jgi:hypothetical protein
MKIFFKKDSLCLSLLAALLILSLEVETWALVLSFLILLTRWGVENRWWSSPSRFWINTLAISSLGLVLFQFRTFTGQEPSSTFLVMLTTLRILDLKTERDEKLLIFLGFVLISLKFLFSIDLYWLPIGAIIYLSLWKALLPADMENPWKITLISLAKSVPIIALLFFAFPRVQVPWAKSWNPPIALVGFSESISPGDIANLALSQETVMRAEFSDYMPPMNSIYWRGAVLEVTDGFGWRKSADKISEDVPTSMIPLRSDYSITLEATFSKVLPTLEHTRMISTPNFRAVKNDRGVFVSQNTVASRIRYLGISSENWSGPTTKNPLDLPQLPPKTSVWLKLQNSKKQTYSQKLRTLKDFFTTQNFAYTRSPGKHRDLDDFLFENQNGFCEHFAGAYAVLARGLGLPARVITGYQGGEKNDSGNFFRVSQADAHAWVEVLDPKGTWKRIDPTFWMAPLRIELGALAYFQLEPSDLGLSPGQALNKLRNQNFGASFFTSLKNQLESLNYIWVRSLLEFDFTEQQRLIQFFAPRMGWWITILVGAIFLMRLIRKWYESLARESEIAVQHYLWLEKKLAKHGFNRKLSQPPVEFLSSLIQKHPELQHLVTQTTNMYRLERYKNMKSSNDDWKRILRGWKNYFRSRKPSNH